MVYSDAMEDRIVAPFTGAWIEIAAGLRSLGDRYESHPSRVRGLKYRSYSIHRHILRVAPFTGAWIEI